MNQDSHSQNNHANKKSTSSDSNELSWLAFRYIAGEMTASECRDFEIRLQDDQLARESVADAVEAMQLLNLAHEQNATTTAPLAECTPRQSTERRPQNTHSSKPVVLAILACSLAAIVIFYGIGQGNNQGPTASSSPAEHAQVDEAQIDLAEAWADSDWEVTLVAHNSTIDFENEFDIDDVSNEFDSDWIEDTIGDLDADSMSAEN